MLDYVWGFEIHIDALGYQTILHQNLPLHNFAIYYAIKLSIHYYHITRK